MVELREGTLGGRRWLGLQGPREDVFRTLGQHLAPRISAVQAAMPEREDLERWRRSEPGAVIFDELERLARRTYPTEMAELDAMAHGAELNPGDLFLANIRGDVGAAPVEGCSDLLWTGDSPLHAHNEDGAPALDHQLTWLTLRINGDPTVVVQWYPGFLPSNAFALTSHGVLWGINHLPITDTAAGAPRHLVARRLQRVARSCEDAAHFLRRHAQAGGFSYNVAELGSGRTSVIECAAGKVAIRRPAPGELSWHTNHPLLLDETSDAPGRPSEQLGSHDESLRRGEVLSSLAVPRGPDPDWMISVLAHQQMPHGVRRDARGSDPLMTLCTTATELTTGYVHITSPGHGVDVRSVTELLGGPP